MNECNGCGVEFEPYLINESMCLDCALDVNDIVIRHHTSVDGTVRNKKLLKRRQTLLGLKGKVPQYTGADRINMTCRGCNEEFVTHSSFKDRVNYCNYCQKLRLNLSDSIPKK